MYLHCIYLEYCIFLMFKHRLIQNVKSEALNDILCILLGIWVTVRGCAHYQASQELLLDKLECLLPYSEDEIKSVWLHMKFEPFLSLHTSCQSLCSFVDGAEQWNTHSQKIWLQSVFSPVCSSLFFFITKLLSAAQTQPLATFAVCLAQSLHRCVQKWILNGQNISGTTVHEFIFKMLRGGRYLVVLGDASVVRVEEEVVETIFKYNNSSQLKFWSKYKM